MHKNSPSTGSLTGVGVLTRAARSEALFRFRHMLFQEYLAARALADGEYADRREDVSLGDHVFQRLRRKRSGEPYVSPQWSEVPPLTCALLRPGEAEAILSSVRPRQDEHLVPRERRHLTLLAGLCLVDTPAVTEQTAAAIEPIAALFRESSGDDTADVQRCVKDLSTHPGRTS